MYLMGAGLAPSADTAGVPEEAEIEAAPIKLRAIEQPVVADYEHRKYLLS